MKPGKARKDRPKGPKSFSRGGSKKVERSATARPAKRDDRSDDRRSEKREERKVFKKPVRVNDREMKREDRRGDRPEKRFDRRQSVQDAVAGKNSVVEALRAKVPAKELVVAIKVEIDEKISEAIRLAKNSDLPIKELPRRALDDLTGSANHQGIALVIKPFNYTEFDKLISNAKKPMMLIGLDGITDPHNLGAVVRSAAAFGADGVVIPERRNASMTGSAWKASAGAAARMPISQVTNLVRSIEDAKKAGCFVIGLDAEGDATLAKMNLATESIFIIVGSEGKGLSRLVRDKCDLVVSIPMQSTVESLNASVATAIVMYQVAAERSK
jgi:23S rRNA (guanosine2251-2'-O)-methyltransferase